MFAIVELFDGTGGRRRKKENDRERIMLRYIVSL
jgi:hypothetical protein